MFDDLAAWVAFVHTTQKQPFSTLAATHDLVPNDLSRLQRHWRQRLDADRALSQRARILREDPPSLPPLTVGERKLVPSPYAPKAAPEAKAEAPAPLSLGAAADVYERLHRMATLYAVLQSRVSLEAAYAEFGFTDVEEAKLAIQTWDGHIKSDDQLRVDFRALISHYRKRRELLLAAGGRSPVVLPPPAATRAAQGPDPEQSIDETAMLEPGFVPLEALPFADVTLVPDTLDTTAFLTAIVFDDDDPVHPFEALPTATPAYDIDATAPIVPALRFSAPTPFENRPPWPAPSPAAQRSRGTRTTRAPSTSMRLA